MHHPQPKSKSLVECSLIDPSPCYLWGETVLQWWNVRGYVLKPWLRKLQFGNVVAFAAGSQTLKLRSLATAGSLRATRNGPSILSR